MQAKYGYDGFGRRLYKLVKQAKRPAQLTVFTWNGDLLTSEETFEGEYSFLARWAYPDAPALAREVPDERYALPIAQRVHSITSTPQQRTHWLYEPESFFPRRSRSRRMNRPATHRHRAFIHDHGRRHDV